MKQRRSRNGGGEEAGEEEGCFIDAGEVRQVSVVRCEVEGRNSGGGRGGVIVRERRRCNVGMVKRATYGRGESGGTTAESFTEITFCSSFRSSRAWSQTAA